METTTQTDVDIESELDPELEHAINCCSWHWKKQPFRIGAIVQTSCGTLWRYGKYKEKCQICMELVIRGYAPTCIVCDVSGG